MQAKLSSGRPAVFLDRDGVLIENIDGDYVRTTEQITVLPGAKAAISQLVEAELLPIIVTNQAAVGKGFISLSQAQKIQRTAEDLVSPDHQIYSTLCPHIEADNCMCRKPKPGMLLNMAQKHGINLRQSFLIGDAMTDVAAARAAGATPILVLSGRGVSQYRQATKEESEGLQVFPTITEATNYILKLGERNDK